MQSYVTVYRRAAGAERCRRGRRDYDVAREGVREVVRVRCAQSESNATAIWFKLYRTQPLRTSTEKFFRNYVLVYLF
jgi:hypothetical protein